MLRDIQSKTMIIIKKIIQHYSGAFLKCETNYYRRTLYLLNLMIFIMITPYLLICSTFFLLKQVKSCPLFSVYK